VFCEKRLQTIENKGSERKKEHKETAKRLQTDANKRVGSFEGLKVCDRECFGGTPAVAGSMRKLLRIVGIRALPGA
jgi:hypothetical protein